MESTHTGEGTPCANVLALHARLEGSRGQKEGGRLGFRAWQGGGAPSLLPRIYTACNGSQRCRPNSNANRSWVNIHISLLIHTIMIDSWAYH